MRQSTSIAGCVRLSVGRLVGNDSYLSLLLTDIKKLNENLGRIKLLLYGLLSNSKFLGAPTLSRADEHHVLRNDVERNGDHLTDD